MIRRRRRSRNRVGRIFRKIYFLAKETIVQYNKDDVVNLGAALSYYTIFSLPAIIIISIGLVGIFFGEEAAKGQIFNQVQSLIGEGAAIQIQEVIATLSDYNQNWWAAVIGIGVLVFGATGVFYALQNALNKIFGVKSLALIGIMRVVTDRVLAFGMVLALSFIVLASLMLNAVFFTLTKVISDNAMIQEYAPNWSEVFMGSGVHVWKNVVSFVAFTLFFALTYKVLPDVRLKWRHIWLGAAITSVLFGIGEFLLGIYISNTNFWSAMGLRVLWW